MAFVAPVDGATSARGNGSNRVQPFVELQVTDGSIAPLSVTPTSETPGPIVYDLDDAIRFSGRFTNTKHVVTVSTQSATDASGSPTKTIQGTGHSIADWIYIRQDAASSFGRVRTTGTYDSDGASYTPPPGLTRDSQGTVALRTYSTSNPVDGGTAITAYWVYDAGSDVYWFDTTDKDFTNGNGETRVYPLAHMSRAGYVFGVGDLSYGVSAVGGAGAGYLPTVQLAWSASPGASGGGDFACTVLFDFPSGSPRDTYDFTIKASVQSLK